MLPEFLHPLVVFGLFDRQLFGILLLFLFGFLVSLREDSFQLIGLLVHFVFDLFSDLRPFIVAFAMPPAAVSLAFSIPPVAVSLVLVSSFRIFPIASPRALRLRPTALVPAFFSAGISTVAPHS